MFSELFKAFAPQAASLLVDGISAHVLRKMPDGTVQDIEIANDRDSDFVRQMRDEYEAHPDDVGGPYVQQ
jgi:hypothetical protein